MHNTPYGLHRLSTKTWFLSALVACLVVPASAQEEYFVELSNGMRLGPGVPSETTSITTDAFQRGGNRATQNMPIGYLDDGLRLTFYKNGLRNVLRREESTAQPFEQIELPSAAESARSGTSPSIQQILALSEFNKYGRRTFSFLTGRGRIDVLQGITLLTPKFAKIEVLHTQTERFVWDSRIATSSIPAAKLREILSQALDLSKSNDWLRMVSFYMQAELYSDAREVMLEALRKFPTELADRRNIVNQLDQLRAIQMFDEIRLRRDSGQPAQAKDFLLSFPGNELPLETQVKLEDEVNSIKQQLVSFGEIAQALNKHVLQLAEPDQQVVAPIVEELLDEITFETVVRLADFQRLRRDDSIPNENKVAFALSGWMLGPGSGLDNFAVVKSLLRVRGLVREYLNDAPPQRRQQILSQLAGEEGAQAQLLDKMLETMKPPRPMPAHRDDDPPGLFRFSVQTRTGETVKYIAQVPPEYDPNRKYPCVLALPGRGERPEKEINWWCGPILKTTAAEIRFGQATRHGYIVVSPDWMVENQAEYQYTENEHTRILTCQRDALRRMSIDTDHVFVAGHYDGATAAWDLALAHPDLWAGAIMISPGADKYIVHYSQNIEGKTASEIPLGTYIVYGQSDGTRYKSELGSTATRYLRSAKYDSLVVEYRGRGRETFIAELPRIIEWMELSSHERIRTPQNIQVTTMRPGDRFFYWLEAPAILPRVAGNPFQLNPAAKGSFAARVLDASVNGVAISKIASAGKNAAIWLTPDMVDFSRPITISGLGNRKRHNLSPDIGIMLEDARQRGDRMHVFWQRVDVR